MTLNLKIKSESVDSLESYKYTCSSKDGEKTTIQDLHFTEVSSNYLHTFLPTDSMGEVRLCIKYHALPVRHLISIYTCYLQ